MITELTPAQESLLPVYREKWQKIGLSTEPIDRQEAEKAVKELYKLLGLNKPRIVFFNSPYEALNQKWSERWIDLLSKLESYLTQQISSQISSQLWHRLWKQLYLQTYNQLKLRVKGYVASQLEIDLGEKVRKLYELTNSLEPEIFISYACLYDFCFVVLTCTYPRQEWQVFQAIVKQCNLVFGLKKIAIVCDRPRQLLGDRENRLHAIGKPAIQFADGYSVYSYHGVVIPEKYGKLPPEQWQAQWLLEEDNAERRRVLIEGIGYDRLCSDLPVQELDTWQE